MEENILENRHHFWILMALQFFILLQARILLFTEKELFIYTILERLKDPLSSSKGGRIISHPPGTGKTKLTIVFLQSFLKMLPKCLLVIIPLSILLLNWEVEFLK
ncbi:hypothetical protein H5410_004202 [Solanum commersonii]|uniref:SNF2 N-terminal domain-containing protein n=1 Tax=Solanum commersonii TaxID=4109 RepID=A0A9J6B6R5_SOLCO|nr:hypothetical protein H5410_004202 [Solanum commersonii]